MDSASSRESLPVGRRGLVFALGALVAGLVTAALALLTLQVEVSTQVEVSRQVEVSSEVDVSGSSTETTRTCGSAFDGVADRSGWEVWWARDLDEPDEAIRDALVRTQQCPDAVNRRIVLAAVLVSAAGSAAACALWLRRGRMPLNEGDVVGRLARLGRITSYAGVGLTVAGVSAIVLLLADAESTLFLYTDRPVVAVGGLIVLVPAVALVVLGRALALLARAPDSVMQRSPVPGPEDTSDA